MVRVGRSKGWIGVALTLVACDPVVVSGPGAEPCFPGGGIDAEPEPVLLRTVGGQTWLVRARPSLELTELLHDRLQPLLQVPLPDGRGVIAVAADGEDTDLIELTLDADTLRERVLTTFRGRSTHDFAGTSCLAQGGEGSFYLEVSPRNAEPAVQRRSFEDGSLLAEAHGVERPVPSPDGLELYVHASDEALEAGAPYVQVLDPLTLEPLRELDLPVYMTVWPSPDGRTLWSWAGPDVASIDRETGAILSYGDGLQPHKAPIELAREGRFVFVGGFRGLTVLDARHGQRCNLADAPASRDWHTAVLANGRYVLAAGDRLALVDTASMTVVDSLPRGDVVTMVPLRRTPTRTGPPAPRGPRLRLVAPLPHARLAVEQGDAPLDLDGARAFIEDRELTPHLRVDGQELVLALGPCETYVGDNEITIAVPDVAGRWGRLLVTHQVPAASEDDRNVLTVYFEEGASPFDAPVQECLAPYGAITDRNGLPGVGPRVTYRLPLCIDAAEARSSFPTCEGVLLPQP